MTLAPDIHTDLVTPLGAYLRLRETGTASFLLESDPALHTWMEEKRAAWKLDELDDL